MDYILGALIVIGLCALYQLIAFGVDLSRYADAEAEHYRAVSERGKERQGDDKGVAGGAAVQTGEVKE